MVCVFPVSSEACCLLSLRKRVEEEEISNICFREWQRARITEWWESWKQCCSPHGWWKLWTGDNSRAGWHLGWAFTGWVQQPNSGARILKVWAGFLAASSSVQPRRPRIQTSVRPLAYLYPSVWSVLEIPRLYHPVTYLSPSCTGSVGHCWWKWSVVQFKISLFITYNCQFQLDGQCPWQFFNLEHFPVLYSP